MAADIFPSTPEIFQIRTHAAGPQGALPLTAEMLGGAPSGDLFGLSQNVGMGWDAALANGPQFLVLSTQGGLRAADGKPIALGYHTGTGKSRCKSKPPRANCAASAACRSPVR